jgi:hypothetical protein
MDLRKSTESVQDLNPVSLCHVTFVSCMWIFISFCVDVELVLLQLATVMSWAPSRLMDVMLRRVSVSAERGTLDKHVTAARLERFIVLLHIA